jgi:hypothetical protein
MRLDLGVRSLISGVDVVENINSGASIVLAAMIGELFGY